MSTLPPWDGSQTPPESTQPAAPQAAPQASQPPPQGPPPGGYRPPPGPPPSYPVTPSAPAPSAPRRSSSGVITCLIVAVVLIAVVMGGLALLASGMKGAGSTQPTWPGETSDTVGVVSIEGLITGGGQVSPFFGATAGSDHITSLLRQAAKDRSLKALVVRVDSPGGSAAASQEIYQAVQEYKRDAKKPVVASMSDVAASGGYYVAAPCDKIVALPATLTGSIGVIMETMEYHELLKKIGVSANALTSGPHKDMGSPFRAMTPEERGIFKAMIDDVYDQFVTAVADGRKMDKAKVRKLADGRVYTGRQAKAVGLVDELGTFHDAIRTAAKMAGIKEEPTVKFFGKMTLFEALFGQVRAQPIRNFPPGLLFDSRLWPVGDMLMTERGMPRLD
jgi:protease-4